MLWLHFILVLNLRGFVAFKKLRPDPNAAKFFSHYRNSLFLTKRNSRRDDVDFVQVPQSLRRRETDLGLFASFSLFFSFQWIVSNFRNRMTYIPLLPYDGVYCANYIVNGDQYTGIVDTGSPFLIVPSICTTQWGCQTPENVVRIRNSTYSHTIEIYGGQDYDVDWKVGDLMLGNKTMSNKVNKDFVFASVGTDILLPPGGVFMGLVKYKMSDIRPTLLEQLHFTSIRFDTVRNMLTLSKTSLIPKTSSSTVLPLVDLRPLGDPVYHYAVKLERLELNGMPIGSEMNCTIYGIFDTGSSGCVLSDDIMNDWNTPNPVRSVKAIVRSESGEEVTFEKKATRKEVFVVTATKIGWFRSNLNSIQSIEYSEESALTNSVQVVILGAIFMKEKVLTIDVDDGRIQLVS